MKLTLPQVLALIGIFSLSALRAEPREFTSSDGKSFVAEPVKVTESKAVFKRAGAPNVTVPISRFTLDDQAWLKKWGEEEKKNLVPRVEIRVNTNKRDRREEDAYEDRRGEFQFEIEIENEERNYDLKGATATLIALGDYMYTKGVGIVMERTEFRKIDIPEGGSTTIKGKRVQYEYDKNGYKHGEKYTGYVFQLKTASGKVIETRGSTARIENEVDSILKFKENNHFDERTFRIQSGTVRR